VVTLKYKIFDINNMDDWYYYLNKLEEKDVYFDPKYCQIYEEYNEGKAFLFVYEEGDNFVYYPFLLRRINNLPQLKNLTLDKEYFDIITPYGYGGPISNVKDSLTKESLFKNFSKVFSIYCEENNIVSEFVRFHPLLGNHQYYVGIDRTFVRNTVYVDLEIPISEITKKYSSQNRNKIRKADKNGLFVRHASISELDRFLELYYRTMDKNNATDYYYFTKEFFLNTLRFLDSNVELVFVQYEEKVVSAGIFMHYNNTVHYHFSGSDREFLKFAPNNLLLDYMIKWSKDKGYKYFHLGGGYKGNDDLYKFKKNFNKNGDLEFFVGKKIRNRHVYEKIKNYLGVSDENGFFPIYRDPNLQIRNS
jgi:hypothetical protein